MPLPAISTKLSHTRGNREERLTIYDLRFTIWDLRLTIYDLRFTIYDLRFTIYDLRLTTYDLRFTIYDLRFTIYDLRLTIYDLRFTTYGKILTSLLFTLYSLLFTLYPNTVDLSGSQYANLQLKDPRSVITFDRKLTVFFLNCPHFRLSPAGSDRHLENVTERIFTVSVHPFGVLRGKNNATEAFLHEPC
jgi:hypothetical protein